MKHSSGFYFIVSLTLLISSAALAYPSLFDSQCLSCHSDDTPTCNGCHEHKGNLSASADQDSYLPGEPVGVVLSGGQQYGWIRARLYDNNDLLVYQASGPTETGDDGGSGDVVFPVSLEGTAPIEPGTYVFEAAWFGGNVSGSSHLEARTPVTIVVESDGTGLPGSDVESLTWKALKALYQ
jgi:hypothetical protein